MIREMLLDDKSIEETLKTDPLKRNQTINTFIALINSIEKSTVLALDGDWGSGKTIFVKQLEYLNRKEITGISSIDDEVIAAFKRRYEVYYFNSWENDFHTDPLESMLFNLINDLWTKWDKFGDKFVKATDGLKKSMIKLSTSGLYDPEIFKNAKSIRSLANNIITADERKKAIDDILNNYIDLHGKKLFFVIDELDRCKPTFAVQLLEVIKHYFNNDKIVFLLATNNSELSHTIQKVYGQTFNGKGYLNKIYDLIFNLPFVPVDEYVKYLGRPTTNGHWKDRSPYEIVLYLKLRLREINRYYSSLDLIDNFFNVTNNFSEDELPYQIVKYVMIPLAYGLRIHDHDKYSRFVTGNGIDLLKGFYEYSDTLQTIMKRVVKEDSLTREKKLEEVYIKLFDKNSLKTQQEYDYHEAIEAFDKVVLLMNASGNIDDEPLVVEKLEEDIKSDTLLSLADDSVDYDHPVVTLKTPNASWASNYGGHGASFLVKATLDNFDKPDNYIVDAAIVGTNANGSEFRTDSFDINDSKTGMAYAVKSGSIEEVLFFLLSDKDSPRAMPDLDRDTVKFYLKFRTGSELYLPVHISQN